MSQITIYTLIEKYYVLCHDNNNNSNGLPLNGKHQLLKKKK